jgi:glycosyltransferase involved in cell wall biosynthesis
MKHLKNIFLLLLLASFSLEAKPVSKKKFSVPLPQNFKRFMPTWDALKKTRNPAVEKEIWVVIPSYNNSEWYKYNLDSIYGQNYTNYKILYVDDCSPDGTGELVEAYVKEKKQEQRTIVIKNTTRKFALENLYNAIHMCPDNAIIATLDGDDWFADPNVLSLINKVYSQDDVWFAYTQNISFPDNKLGYCQAYPQAILAKQSFRHCIWRVSHLRTFYAWLFKKIKIEDLKENGQFFAVAYDVAITYPMLEMAYPRFKFIPDVTYVRNVATPLNDFKVHRAEQKRVSHHIMANLPAYKAL